jgi:TatD DNase family protein
MFHDTHAHIDLYLQRVGSLPPERELNLETAEASQGTEIRLDVGEVEKLLDNHEFVVQPTISNGNFILNAQLWRDMSKIYLLMGSHPEIVHENFDLPSYVDQQQDIVVQMQTDAQLLNQLVGVGECGLDYHYSDKPEVWRKQRSLFESQIELAVRLNLPLIIHCREAFEDLFSILKDYPEIHGKFLVHCFTAGPEELAQIINFRGLVGLGGVVTFNSANDLRQAVRECPMDHFTLETDLPFLAPVPHRGQICKPEYIDLVAEQISQIKSETKAQVWSSSRQNALKLFPIDLQPTTFSLN